MYTDKAAENLTQELENVIKTKLGGLFERYGLDLDILLTPLKWKPLILVIGNYSSGKSTFINECLNTEIQRTGQAPTDDAFTVITGTEPGGQAEQLPGSTVVSDERLPFNTLRRFGESLIAHLRMKKIDSHLLANLAIIDTPGMLDSVTEKDRGYDYLGVVGELARLADVIILMFDPHKAGTIKETYQVIRSTLPGTTGEDRIFYVMNRIDECDNVADLVRSYGTLCWNLSQMTGRKDMPRIFLTFAPQEGRTVPNVEVFAREREELKKALTSAPRMRLSHILQKVDLVVRELGLQLEALSTFRNGFRTRLRTVFRVGGITSALVFLFGDLVLKLFTGYPQTTLTEALLQGGATPENLVLPAIGAMLVAAGASLYVQRVVFPAQKKAALANLDALVTFDSAYKRDLWERVRVRVQAIITDQARRQFWIGHGRNLARVQRFLEKDLAGFYERIQIT